MPSGGGGGRSAAKWTGRQAGVFHGKTEWLPLIKSKTFFSEVTGGSQCKKYGRAMQCKSKSYNILFISINVKFLQKISNCT